MIKIIDFTNYPQQYQRTYGGASGRKYDILLNGEHWFLKFPGNIRDQVEGMSYSNNAVSEYVGSKIYESLDIEVHDTVLGIYGNKCVVACRDFVKENEFPVTGFGEFKTTFIPAFCDSQGNETNGNGTDLEEIIKTLDEHPVLKEHSEIKARFWDMFVIDALIGNNDRNNGNWGMIKNRENGYRISPVYDNGAAFLPKTPDNKAAKVLNDPMLLQNVAYSGYFCIFTLGGHRINPLKYIEEMGNEDCNAAVKRIVPRIDISKIRGIFSEIPNEYNGVEIISDNTKKLYTAILEKRYEYVLKPALRKIQQLETAVQKDNAKTVKQTPKKIARFHKML